MKDTRPNVWGDFTGAFADGAVLFPLMAALGLQTGMSGAILLAGAGLAYIAAGVVFRVPMAVQPLKSVVVAALAAGATAAEISLSGLAVGIVCLALSYCYANRMAALVPRHIVHGLQLALGIMLMAKAMAWDIHGREHLFAMAGFLALTLSILFFSYRTDKPVMGWVAAAGILAGLVLAFGKGTAVAPVLYDMPVRPGLILSLVLPQLALTLTNSVVGMHDVALRYFGDRAWRVTPARLLRSIGIGNILAAPLGGLPFCHGAGGLTAHVKGGAVTWHMNLIIGTTLLALAGLSWLWSLPVIPSYPKILMAAMLFSTGWFHIRLATPSWKSRDLRWILLLMGGVALLSQNMLWTLVAGIGGEVIRRHTRKDILERKPCEIERTQSVER